jgi:hypothetical protein
VRLFPVALRYNPETHFGIEKFLRVVLAIFECDLRLNARVSGTAMMAQRYLYVVFRSVFDKPVLKMIRNTFFLNFFATTHIPRK